MILNWAVLNPKNYKVSFVVVRTVEIYKIEVKNPRFLIKNSHRSRPSGLLASVGALISVT